MAEKNNVKHVTDTVGFIAWLVFIYKIFRRLF